MRVTALILIIFLIISAVSGFAQSTVPSTTPADTIFIELMLDDEGITAYDSLGRNWYYDFDNGYFVLGRNVEAENNFVEQDPNYEEIIPVEERCTEQKFVKAWTKSVTVGTDEYVEGNIIAYGRVTIKGWVKGDVTSINNRVLISAGGQVDGNVTAPEIIVKDGGVILGQENVSENPLDLINFRETFNFSGFIVIVIIMIVFYLVGLLMKLIMPRHVDNLSECMQEHKLRTTMLGFFLVIISPLIIGLVIITIVGIVISPFIPILYLLAMILGVVTLGQSVGGKLSQLLFKKSVGGIFETFVGMSLFWISWLAMGILMGSSNSVAFGFGVFFLVVSILISLYPVFAGVGAAFLTRFGVRSYTSWKERFGDKQLYHPPAPPPIPEPPGGQSSSDN